jgi:hypothetical protein
MFKDYGQTMIASSPVFDGQNIAAYAVVLIGYSTPTDAACKFCVTKWFYHSDREHSNRGNGHYFPVRSYETTEECLAAAWGRFNEIVTRALKNDRLADNQEWYIDHHNLQETDA